jgi:hypothetical protein
MDGLFNSFPFGFIIPPENFFLANETGPTGQSLPPAQAHTFGGTSLGSTKTIPEN